jgi:two-component system chemotaxis response regulator CheY
MGEKDLAEGLLAPSFLIVDDDAQVRSIIVEYLRLFGFEKIKEAKDGQQALKIIHDLSQPIDIILSDWEMPNVDGLTLLKAVRNQPGRVQTRFVMITSQASQERMKVAQAVRLRVDDYIIKPFRGDVFRTKIFNLVSEISRLHRGPRSE